jgi:hypothetical protein
MKLQPIRIDDVPIRELSGLALEAARSGPRSLLAIGDRKSVLAKAVVGDGPLSWSRLDLADESDAVGKAGQFEAIAATGDGQILVLCEDPPLVRVLGPGGEQAGHVRLMAGDRGVLADIFDDSSSAGEGLVVLQGGRLLMAKEKEPPLLVEFGPPGSAPEGIAAASFSAAGEPAATPAGSLQALAAWSVEDVEDISDVWFGDGVLYCLSDQSRCVVTVDLPLRLDTDRADTSDRWDLEVPERRGEPDGKPEGLVVTDDGTLIVGLDTRTAKENLCWYRP